jgi:hypothetical protein
LAQCHIYLSAFSLWWPHFLVFFPPPFVQYGHTILELYFMGCLSLKKLHAILAIPQSVLHHLKMPYSTNSAVYNLQSFSFSGHILPPYNNICCNFVKCAFLLSFNFC